MQQFCFWLSRRTYNTSKTKMKSEYLLLLLQMVGFRASKHIFFECLVSGTFVDEHSFVSHVDIGIIVGRTVHVMGVIIQYRWCDHTIHVIIMQWVRLLEEVFHACDFLRWSRIFEKKRKRKGKKKREKKGKKRGGRIESLRRNYFRLRQLPQSLWRATQRPIRKICQDPYLQHTNNLNL